jgi:translation initiation factor IF-2
VLLEAEMLELKANPNRRATGSIIESSLDKGRGYVATVLVSNGTLKMGDIVLAGTSYGKDKVTTEELFGKVDDWMRNFERDMDADRSRIQRLKEKVLTPGELYMIIGMLTALRVSHDSADKRLASQVDTYPLNQGQISVFTEELLKLSLEQPRITAWDVYNVATEIYKPGKTDFPAMIPQNGAMADFLLSYNQN